MVQTGQLELELDPNDARSKRELLDPGDYMSFTADVPHVYTSVEGDLRATLIMHYAAGSAAPAPVVDGTPRTAGPPLCSRRQGQARPDPACRRQPPRTIRSPRGSLRTLAPGRHELNAPSQSVAAVTEHHPLLTVSQPDPLRGDCLGKGRKHRSTPLTSRSVAVKHTWLAERDGAPSEPPFPGPHGAPLSRDAIRRLITKHATAATGACPPLAAKSIGAHTLRHTAAMRLLESGTDTAVIALWLGHQSPRTTQVYLHAHLALKERALARTTPYASHKDWPAIAKDLKPIYTAPTEAAALERLADFSGRWEARYPAIVKLWESAWAEFVPFLSFDAEIRTVIYTTNAIESINSRVRKAVKARGHFPTETAAIKCIYLAIMSLDPTGRGRQRWTNRWKPALNAFTIAFPGRILTSTK